MQATTNPVGVFWASLVRTIVPVIAGYVITWFATAGIVTTDEFSMALEGLLVAAFTVIYYVAARALETFVAPKFGWLLGYAKAPAQYSPVKPQGQ